MFKSATAASLVGDVAGPRIISSESHQISSGGQRASSAIVVFANLRGRDRGNSLPPRGREIVCNSE